jgi:hypothetical protein
VKGIEPLLTILEIVALTVILHSLASNFYFLTESENIVISSFNLITFKIPLLSFIYSHPR